VQLDKLQRTAASGVLRGRLAVGAGWVSLVSRNGKILWRAVPPPGGWKADGARSPSTVEQRQPPLPSPALTRTGSMPVPPQLQLKTDELDGSEADPVASPESDPASSPRPAHPRTDSASKGRDGGGAAIDARTDASSPRTTQVKFTGLTQTLGQL
jgi:hypothetical protein